MRSEKLENLGNEVTYMIKFFEIVLNLPAMKETGLIILTKKEKLRIYEFIMNLKLNIEEESHEEIDKTASILK